MDDLGITSGMAFHARHQLERFERGARVLYDPWGAPLEMAFSLLYGYPIPPMSRHEMMFTLAMIAAVHSHGKFKAEEKR